MWNHSKHWDVILDIFGVVHLPPVPFVVTDVLLRLAFSSLELPGVSPPPTREWGLARSCISIDLLEQEVAEQKLKSQQWFLINYIQFSIEHPCDLKIITEKTSLGRWTCRSMKNKYINKISLVVKPHNLFPITTQLFYTMRYRKKSWFSHFGSSCCCPPSYIDHLCDNK